jgi:hypothetical protein
MKCTAFTLLEVVSSSWCDDLVIQQCTWCGNKVPGMILLHHFKKAKRFDHSKDIPVHVSTCTSYDFKALLLVVWKFWC